MHRVRSQLGVSFLGYICLKISYAFPGDFGTLGDNLLLASLQRRFQFWFRNLAFFVCAN